MSLATSFPPIATRMSCVLILGSMPGRESLARQQYYAHPRNAFWYIMGQLFDAGPDLPYRERLRRLQVRQIAVWDVLEQCEREGSLDTSIRRSTEVANPLPPFLARHRHIRAVFFNGRKAEAAFMKHVVNQLPDAARYTFRRLPSTSPAFASLTAAEKLAQWRAVTKAVEPPIGT